MGAYLQDGETVTTFLQKCANFLQIFYKFFYISGFIIQDEETVTIFLQKCAHFFAKEDRILNKRYYMHD